jgi:hypothetical protein
MRTARLSSSAAAMCSGCTEACSISHSRGCPSAAWIEIPVPERIVDGFAIRLRNDAQPASALRHPIPMAYAPVELPPFARRSGERAVYIGNIDAATVRLRHHLNSEITHPPSIGGVHRGHLHIFLIGHILVQNGFFDGAIMSELAIDLEQTVVACRTVSDVSRPCATADPHIAAGAPAGR